MTSPPAVVGVGLVTIDDVFLVDSLPQFGRSQRARARTRQCGGPAATAMAALSRLGVSTRMIAKIGDDADGDFLCSELGAFGVDVSFVQRGKGASKVAAVFVDVNSGERGFLSTVEGFAPLGATDVRADALAGATIVHIDDADEAGLAAARLAHAAGQRVVFDGTWQSDQLDQFLPLVEAAIVSEFFARKWMPALDPATDADLILRRLLDLGANTAVLTCGDRGAVAMSVGGAPVSCPAFTVPVVDTTGAGDAFHGGYIYGMLQDWSLPRILRFAAATGALNCRQLGGQAGLPRRAEVEALLTSSQAV